MPCFHTAGHHIGRCVQRFADPAVPQEFVTGLQRRSHKGVWGAADGQSLFMGQLQDLLRIFHRQRERLFAEKMPAREKNLSVDLCVELRRGEIDYDLDLVHGE